LDDPGVADRIRADIGRAASAQPGIDLEAGAARLEAAIAAGGGPAGTSGAGLVWGVSMFAAVGVAALIGWLSTRSRPEASPPPPVRAAHVESPPAVESVAPVPAPPPPPASAAPPSPAAHAPRHPAASSAWPEPPDDRIAREIESLARTRAALGTDPAAALALATAGDREFPDGLLGQEREAIAILALDRLGRAAEARDRAGRFLDRYPRGPFTQRIQAVRSRP
jgi:hypothetical protein